MPLTFHYECSQRRLEPRQPSYTLDYIRGPRGGGPNPVCEIKISFKLHYKIPPAYSHNMYSLYMYSLACISKWSSNYM